jgi:hypothetical protein
VQVVPVVSRDYLPGSCRCRTHGLTTTTVISESLSTRAAVLSLACLDDRARWVELQGGSRGSHIYIPDVVRETRMGKRWPDLYSHSEREETQNAPPPPENGGEVIEPSPRPLRTRARLQIQRRGVQLAGEWEVVALAEARKPRARGLGGGGIATSPHSLKSVEDASASGRDGPDRRGP